MKNSVKKSVQYHLKNIAWNQVFSGKVDFTKEWIRLAGPWTEELVDYQVILHRASALWSLRIKTFEKIHQKVLVKVLSCIIIWQFNVRLSLLCLSKKMPNFFSPLHYRHFQTLVEAIRQNWVRVLETSGKIIFLFFHFLKKGFFWFKVLKNVVYINQCSNSINLQNDIYIDCLQKWTFE